MNQLLTGVVITNHTCLTLEEFAHAINTNQQVVIEMVEYQLLQPQGKTPEEWRFDSICLKRGRTAVSFYRDLEVNMPGIALALELIDKLETLQHQLDFFEKIANK